MDEELKEKLLEMGVDIKSAMDRFMGNAQLLVKFLKRFPDDESYQKLCDAIEAKDYDTAFKAAHTMKGLCGNLSLSGLQDLVSDQTELLRAGKGEEATVLMPKVKAEYERVIAKLDEL